MRLTGQRSRCKTSELVRSSWRWRNVVSCAVIAVQDGWMVYCTSACDIPTGLRGGAWSSRSLSLMFSFRRRFVKSGDASSCLLTARTLSQSSPAHRLGLLHYTRHADTAHGLRCRLLGRRVSFIVAVDAPQRTDRRWWRRWRQWRPATACTMYFHLFDVACVCLMSCVNARPCTSLSHSRGHCHALFKSGLSTSRSRNPSFSS